MANIFFGHFLLIVNAYKGGPRTQIFQGGGGWGGKFFPRDGVPTSHSYRNPLSLMIYQEGGVPDTPYGSVLAYPKMEWV